jgi:hypothetical protein
MCVIYVIVQIIEYQLKQITKVSVPSSNQASCVHLFNDAVSSSGTALDGRMGGE